MYHHFPGKGKEALALDAISRMRASTIAFLDGNITPRGTEPEVVRACIVAALGWLFSRQEGHALVRLLADPLAGASESLAIATQDWCDGIRTTISVKLRADEPDEDPEAADLRRDCLLRSSMFWLTSCSQRRWGGVAGAAEARPAGKARAR